MPKRKSMSIAISWYKTFGGFKNQVYSYETGIYYSGIYALLEKIGDFVINITEAMVNTIHQRQQPASCLLRFG